MMDLLLTNLQIFNSQDVNRWTWVVWIVDYCHVFYQLFGLSFWWHPFTAEDLLVSKWRNAKFLQIWWRNKLICILDGLRVITFSANVHFWVNYSFKLIVILYKYFCFTVRLLYCRNNLYSQLIFTHRSPSSNKIKLGGQSGRQQLQIRCLWGDSLWVK